MKKAIFWVAFAALCCSIAYPVITWAMRPELTGAQLFKECWQYYALSFALMVYVSCHIEKYF